MKSDSDFRNRIGISNRALRRMPVEETIDTVCETGFRVFEVVPHIFGPQGRPESLGQEERRRLKKRLSCFETVTLHCSGAIVPGMPVDKRVDIASPDPSYRRKSVEHLLTLTQLALDIGVNVVTYHRGVGDEKTTPTQLQEAMLTFARMAIEKVKDRNIQMGYEIFVGDPRYGALIEEIGDPRFGILFDIGHAAMRFEGDLTAGVLRLLEKSAPFIVQFHAHGIQVMEDGVKHDHRPIQVNNGIDYAKVISAIKEHGFSYPLIFEIGTKGGPQEVRDSVYAREEFIKIWQAC